jgi:hypothetical protein
LFEVALVEDLVRPLTVWKFILGVEVTVNGLEKLLKTKLDYAIRNTKAGSCDAVLRIDGGKCPD